MSGGPGTALKASNIEAKVIELSTRSFEAFGEDLACMLGLETTGKDLGTISGKTADLKKQFRRINMAGTVRSEGYIQGNFFMVLDAEALFTLSGVLVVQPEKVIIQNRRAGTKDSAEGVSDAVGEIGNLLIGSFDRIFRESNTRHGHFVYIKTYIGDPWTDPAESIGLSPDEELLINTYEMTISPYGPCKLMAVYPRSAFAGCAEEDVKPVVTGSDEKKLEAAEVKTEIKKPEKPVAEVKPQEPPKPLQQESKPPQSETVTKQQPTPEPKEVQEQASSGQSNAEKGGMVAESIRKITQSPAVLPGQGHAQTVLARDIMGKAVIWASGDETVEAALAKMNKNDCGYLLVGKDGKLEGLVSRSDLRAAMSPYLMNMFAKWRRPLDTATLQIRIKWIMARPAVTMRSDANLAAVVRQMQSAKVHCMPVTDANGKIEGVITTGELLNFLSSI